MGKYFGTDGFRGEANVTLNVEHAFKVGRYLGWYYGQNKKANIYSEKVNILPIEGDGTKINPNYQIRLSSAELADGKLDKEPSRIIVTDITTIDKARLGRWIGRLTPECIATIEKLLKNHLEL